MGGAAPDVRVEVLGHFAVVVDGREQALAAFGGRKTRLLIRVLAARRGRPVDHDTLAEALWPDGQPRDPAGNLGVLVKRARTALTDPGLIRTTPGAYLLADRCAVDAVDFGSAVDLARLDRDRGELRSALDRFRTALGAWGTPFPEDRDADWARPVRQHLVDLHRAARLEASEVALRLGDAARAAELAAAAARDEPLDERARLALIRAHAAAGETAAALAAYDELRRTLADELGADPSEEARALHLAVLASTGRPGSTVAPGSPRIRLVGRTHELAAALDAVRTGRRVEVLGPAGWGKSRLLEELALRLPDELSVWTARAVLAERDEPWSLLRALLGPVLTPAPRLRELLPPLAREALDAVLAPEPGPGVGPDPQARHALVVAGLVALLGQADRPVLVLDDLQWADQASAGALAVALDRRPDVACVVAARPGEPAGDDGTRALRSILGGPRVLRLDLTPLTGEQVAALAGSALADAICTTDATTPFEVTQVLTGLGSEGLAAPGPDGRWHPVSPGAAGRALELALAGTRRMLLAAVAARPPGEVEVVRLLSLLGRPATPAQLGAAARRPVSDVEAALAGLASAGLVRATGRGWATGHDLLSETVTTDLSPADATHLHRCLARAVEDAHERAVHLDGAGEPDAAAAAYATAARALLDARSAEDAAALAGRGLVLATRDPDRVALHDVRASARSLTGDLPGAREDLRSALHLGGPGADRSRLLSRLAMSYAGAEDPSRARELSELALVEAGEDDAARAVALEVGSILDVNLGEEARARARAEAARALYVRLGDALGTARILDARAMATFLAGDIRTGERLFARVAGIFEDCGDLFRVLTPRSTQGHALVFLDRPAEGLVAATSSLRLARELGHREGEAYALWHRSEALSALDRPGEAEADAVAALAIAERIGHRGWTATSLRALGIARFSGGDVDGAHEAFRRSLEHADGLDLFCSWAAARLALCEIGLGSLDRARRHVSLALATGPGLAGFEGRWAEAELAAASGEDPEALVAAAVARAEEGGALATVGPLRALLG